MNIFAKIMGLLPTLIVAIETVGNDLAGHQKKQAVTDALASIADGVAQACPEHGPAAQAAAKVANAAIDGVVTVLKLTGALPSKTAPASPAAQPAA